MKGCLNTKNSIVINNYFRHDPLTFLKISTKKIINKDKNDLVIKHPVIESKLEKKISTNKISV